MFYVPEVTYGVTPVSDPGFIDLRHTGTSLGLGKESFQSEELHADRQVRDFRHGVKAVGGDISFELSYSSFDDFLEATLMGTWTADVLKAGVVRRSFSILRHFEDLPAGDPYFLYAGVELNSLSLTIPASGMVTGSFTVLGQSQNPLADLSSLGTPTFTAPLTTQPFDSFTGSILEAGGAVSVVTEVALTLENGLEARNVIGSDETILPSSGRCNLTGSVTAYFEDTVILDKFLDETESTLEVTLTDPEGNSYTILLPRIKYNGGQPDVAGGGGPITINFPLQALYDTGELSNISITRTPA